MNFLTRTLGSLTGTALPYNIGTPIESHERLYNLYEGTSKNDGSYCTVFEFNNSNSYNSPKNLEVVRTNIQKLKSIRIPGVLKIFDSVDDNNNSVYYFTEPVISLIEYLEKYPDLNEDSKLLGIYSISKALFHLNVDGKAIHGNLDINNVYVTQSGEWKLNGFELSSNIENPNDFLFNHQYCEKFNNILPPEIQSKGIDVLRNNKRNALKLDSYKLGGFIWCVFNKNYNTNGLNNNDLLKINKIPKFLQLNYKKLLQNSITARITIENFYKTSFDKSNNLLINNYKELDELHLKNNHEKLEFMKNLESLKKIAPPGFMEFKIIPELIQLFNINLQQQNIDMNQLATCLYYILTFAEGLNEENFNKIVTPIIIKSFTLPDRTIRMTLLTSLPQYIEKVPKNDVSGKIFSNLLTGFSDTNPIIREETLKSIIQISSKLTDYQISKELLRYLAKLQNDEKPEIRTNTVIVLCKIASKINKSSRSGVLITAFNKSLKDDFLPTRFETLNSFEKCIDLFNPDICCSKILSCIAPCLLDSSRKIRKKTKEVFDIYMEKIEKEAERLPAAEDENDEHYSPDEVLNSVTKVKTEKPTKESKGIGFSFGGLSFGISTTIDGRLENDNIPLNDSNNNSSINLNNNSSTSINRPKPSISKPKYESFTSNDEEVVDEGWDFDMDDEIENENDKEIVKTQERLKTLSIKKPISKAPKKLGFGKTASSTTTATTNHGLKLGKNHNPKLNLKIDDDDMNDGWGDGW